MAKKAAARTSKAKKAKKTSAKKARGAAARTSKVRVSFEQLHAEIDAALAQLQARQPGTRRDALIGKLKVMRRTSLCPVGSMFIEMA